MCRLNEIKFFGEFNAILWENEIKAWVGKKEEGSMYMGFMNIASKCFAFNWILFALINERQNK